MKAQSSARTGERTGRRPTLARDPLQIPVAMDFARDRRLERVMDVLRSVAAWALVFAVAASGALLLASKVPS